ncbi:alanine--tRNA ligase [Candidatus Shapirobacteria bacterium]|nr:alanine--tRNA ligase [Candidatus Shapirobacteria bacterium]
MTARELKDLYIKFFLDHQHLEIPSARLVPENDPTTLFISAGMHPLVPFLLGQPHPQGTRIVDVQKCVRTGDIDEVGDTTHHTFFEMLGNWSLGDYFKSEMIPMSYQFLTDKKYLGIDPKYLAITCFLGDENAPKDTDSRDLWLKQGVSEDRIAFLPKENNWWGPAGVTGPCGPDSEMFYWIGTDAPPQKFDPDDSRWVEIWNDVFMQYNKNSAGVFELLPKPNVDTGMGVERTTAVLNGLSDNYLSPIFLPIIQKIEELSNLKYTTVGAPLAGAQKSMRIVADHVRSAVFIIADGVEPSNKEAGYVLRRLIRRAIRQGKLLNINTNFTKIIAQSVLDNQINYAGVYPELNLNSEKILTIIDTEENRFRKSLDKGLSEINKLITRNHNVTGKEAFDLYQSFGFPVEMIQEELSKNNLSLDKAEFNKFREEHSKLSQTLSAGKFKSGLADHSEIITKYHTATHLLHASLRKILGDHVHQTGSNITSERLRFDFSHPEKLTPEHIKQVENMVNEQIKKDLTITCDTLLFTEAQKKGALAFFGAKYPETVTMYTVGPGDSFFSREVCTGPHVEHTGVLGVFEITKEESASAGHRRLYAVLR